jgi:hypothetical protein
VKIVFVAAAVAQLVLGAWRARMLGSSILPALALTALIAAVGIIRKWPSIARFGALLATTAGVLSAISAFNAPLIGNVARISVPLFAFAIAAVLYVPNHRLSAAVFVIAVAVLEYDLTRDALWENSGLRSEKGFHHRVTEYAENVSVHSVTLW